MAREGDLSLQLSYEKLVADVAIPLRMREETIPNTQSPARRQNKGGRTASQEGRTAWLLR